MPIHMAYRPFSGASVLWYSATSILPALILSAQPISSFITAIPRVKRSKVKTKHDAASRHIGALPATGDELPGDTLPKGEALIQRVPAGHEPAFDRRKRHGKPHVRQMVVNLLRPFA